MKREIGLIGCIIIFLSLFSFISANPYSSNLYEEKINYSLIPTVNNSQYLQGYTPTTLKDWIQGLFDSVYCKLTGCTMQGDINMDSNDILNVNNITAQNFIGDWDGLADGTAQGQMSFWDATLNKWVQTETSELFWDDVHKRLGIGTGSPLDSLQINGKGAFGDSISSALWEEVGNNRALALLDTNAVMRIWRVHDGFDPAMEFINSHTSAPTVKLGWWDMYMTAGADSKFSIRDRLAALPRLTIDTNGNVGIGHFSPSAKLHVKGIGKTAIRVEAVGGSNRDYEFYTDGSNLFIQGVGSSGTLRIGEDGAPSFFMDLGAPDNSFHMTSTGRIGFGTSSPDTKLQVVGDFKSGADTTNYFSLASDGEVGLHGTARVEKILFFDLTRMKKGVGNPPLENVEDGFRTYDFDKTIDEEMFSTFSGPLEWAPGTDAMFHSGFFIDTAPTTAQNVVWGVEYKSIACDGVFDFTSGTTTVTDIVAIETGTPTNDKKIHYANIIIPSAGLIEEGLLMVRVFRDADHVNDTFDGDARMFNLHIHYFADKLGRAT